MIYILISKQQDDIEEILFVSTSKKNALAKFSEYKQLSDSEYEMYGKCDEQYELREYYNDYDIADFRDFTIIDHTVV